MAAGVQTDRTPTVRKGGPTMLFNILVFLLFVLLWGAFAAALMFSQGPLDNVWHQARGLPLPTLVLAVFRPWQRRLERWPVATQLVGRDHARLVGIPRHHPAQECLGRLPHSPSSYPVTPIM